MPLPQLKNDSDEALHKEMERISLDWCMIYNPTDEDFFIDWLPWHHLVPNKNKDIGWGNGKLEVQRYLARWYCEHMSVYIINKEGQEIGEALLKKRDEQGLAKLTSFEEQKAIWEKTPRWNDNAELSKLYPVLFLGITREFGMDYQPQQQGYAANTETPQENVMKKMENKKYKPTPQQTEPIKHAGGRPKTVTEAPSVESIESLITGNDEILK